MNLRIGTAVLVGWLAAAAPVWAQGHEFALADAQLARLGIVLASPTAVTEMEIASAPAEVVVPPARQALISAPVDGLVARIHADAGETVARGQPVAELEGPEVLSWQRGVSRCRARARPRHGARSARSESLR